jgi:hypothetical protein
MPGCIIVNLNSALSADALRRISGLADGVILSTRALSSTPDAAYRLITKQYAAEELMTFDRRALEMLASVSRTVADRMAHHPDAARQAQLFALFAGMRDASRRLAFALSLLTLLKRENPHRIALIGSETQVSALQAALGALPGVTISAHIVPPALRGNRKERAYRAIADHPLFATLASLLLNLRHRCKHGVQARATQTASPILIEASSRLESYLRVVIGNGSKGFVLTQRRHMAIHVDPLYRIAPSLRILFLDHVALKPRHLFAWLRLRHYLSPPLLTALADDMLRDAIPDATERGILNNLLMENASVTLWSWLAAEEVIRVVAPARLVLHNDNDLFERALLARARQAGILVTAIQHGAFTEPLNLDGFEADEYLVWGQGSEDLLRRFGRTRPRISSIGHPGYAKAAQDVVSRSKPDTPRILYATRSNSSETASYYPGREGDFFDLIEQAWPGAAAQLVIKPHPRANPMSWYRKRVQKFMAGTGAAVSVTTEPLMQQIAASDYVISTGGTTVLEAVALKRTCIFILPPGREDVMGWSRFRCLHLLSFGNSDGLRRLLAQPGAAWLDFDAPEIAQERLRFLEHFIRLSNVKQAEEIVAQLAASADQSPAAGGR